jgi:hypothetical protein
MNIQSITEENTRLVAELARLETMALQGDCERCANCRGVWDIRDLEAIGDDKYCPVCVSDERAVAAYEAKADAAIDAEYRACRR